METVIKPALLNWSETKIKGFQSKQLLYLDNGGIKLIKVAPSSEYPIHHHPGKTEFIYVLEGSPGITIEEKYHTGNQGDFFILPTSVKHGISNKSAAECVLLVGAISTDNN